MSVVYIVSHNGSLSKDGLVLWYRDHTGLQTKLLPEKISQIVVVGNMEISGQALHMIMGKKIPMVFLQKNGRSNGKLVYEDNKNTLLRHQQHVRYQDAQFQKTIAQDIVRGKLHNEYLFLQRIARKLPDDQKLEQELVNLERVRKKLEEVADVDEIRGYEGQGARIYFRVFGLNLLPEWALFHTRSKNPPLDPVNSVLSFLYTMLANRIDTYIFLEGLDASIGNLHALSYGRKSLVFDLMEEFRTPIVDTLVCSLFNMGTLKPHDFHTEDVLDGTEEELVGDDVKQRAVLLTEEGMRKVLIQFEKKLSTEHTYPIQNKIISYDGILHGQVNQYKQVVTGQRDHYLPLVVT